MKGALTHHTDRLEVGGAPTLRGRGVVAETLRPGRAVTHARQQRAGPPVIGPKEARK
jgi:hypothetical protein